MEKTLIVMRGLPWCGKSTRAAVLAGDVGVICSTDEFWHKVVNPEKPEEYSFKRNRLGEAHTWNRLRAQKHIEEGHPLVIIDNTNTTKQEAYPYVWYAACQGYEVLFEEPDSPRWLEIRPLLRRKRDNKNNLRKWANILAEGSKETHNVPAWSIERMMWRWEEFGVDDVLACEPATY